MAPQPCPTYSPEQCGARHALVCIATLATLAILAGACGERQFGMGIGRPPIREVVQVEPLDLMITEAYIAATNPAQRFVELAATGSDPVSLDDLQLCNIEDCIPLTGDITGGTRVVLLNDTGTLDLLGLLANAGELAVVDANGFVHAYLAWGADPTTLGSTLYSAAVANGVATPGEFVSLPYPMTDDIAVAVDGTEAGCATPTPGAATPVIDIDPSHCLEVAPVLHLTEVFPAAAAGEDSWVEIQYLPAGSRALDLYGVRVCQPPSCIMLGATDRLEPGEFLEIHFGVDAPATATSVERYFADASPLAATGEVAIYAPGLAALDDAESMLSFVRYGNAASSLAATAVDAGVWATAADSTPAPDTDESIGTIGALGASGASWSAGRPTPGVDTRCGAPASPGAISALVIRSIERTTPARIVLRNRGVVALDAAGWSVELGALVLPLSGPNNLAANAEITVELDPEGDGCSSTNECWADAAALIGADGEASLREGTTLRLFVRWGIGQTLITSEAVADGLWPHVVCTTQTLDDGDELRLIDDATGHSPLDYE